LPPMNRMRSDMGESSWETMMGPSARAYAWRRNLARLELRRGFHDR
jgi:hypothetical protein